MKAAATLGLCLLMAVMAVGCATTSAKGPTDEEQVQGVVTQWSELLPAGEVDKLMALHSENFKFDDGGKAELGRYLNEHKSDVTGAEVDTKNAKITVTEDKATAGPIGLAGPGFSIDLTLDLTKENGQWLITGMSGS
jgi:hypothetical protein